MENPLETHNQSQKSTLAPNWSYRRLAFRQPFTTWVTAHQR